MLNGIVILLLQLSKSWGDILRKALIVGINNYPTSPLNGCVKDAVEMATVLERDADGSPNFSVRLLTEPADTITRGSLRQHIEQLFEGPSDVALFYFSGHGMVNSSGGLIVTPDHSAGDEGISMDQILNWANRSRAREKVIILDCCHSGQFASPALDGGDVARLGDGLTVLTASRASEYAMERGGSGVFTSLIIDALHGGAADLRGFVTPGGIYSYVDSALGDWEQRPVFKTNVSRFTHLRRVIPPIPIETVRKIKEFFPVPEHEYPLDPSFEDTVEGHSPSNALLFKQLQKMFSVGLVRPVGEEFMYFAAMNSKSCRLTVLGYQYWRMVDENKL